MLELLNFFFFWIEFQKAWIERGKCVYCLKKGAHREGLKSKVERLASWRDFLVAEIDCFWA